LRISTVLIQRRADATDLAATNPQPEAFDRPVDASRRHATEVSPAGRPPAAPAPGAGALEKAREVTALPDRRDLQLDLTRPRGPAPRANSRCDASRDPWAGAHHAPPRSALELDQLRGDRPNRLADHVGALIEQHLPDDLLDHHPVGTGHAAPAFVEP